jgi:hypothetical protein
MEIRKAGDADLQLITSAWDREDREWKARHGEALKHRTHLAESRAKAELAFNAAVQRYERLHGKPAPITRHVGSLLYLGIALLLSVFEIPINLSFFRLFGESEVFTALSTACMSFSLMLCSHFLGILLRQGDFAGWVKKILIACMVAIPLVLISGVAVLRVDYIHRVDETSRSISPVALLAVSAALNLLMVTVATVAAYALHEEGRPDVDSTRRALKRATSEARSAEKSLTVLEQRRHKIFDLHKTQAQHIKDVAEGLVETYRTANLAFRNDRANGRNPAYPASYLQEVIVKIPMPLRSPEPPYPNDQVGASSTAAGEP